MTVTQVKQDTMGALPVMEKLHSGNRMLSNHEINMLDKALRSWDQFFQTAP